MHLFSRYFHYNTFLGTVYEKYEWITVFIHSMFSTSYFVVSLRFMTKFMETFGQIVIQLNLYIRMTAQLSKNFHSNNCNPIVIHFRNARSNTCKPTIEDGWAFLCLLSLSMHIFLQWVAYTRADKTDNEYDYDMCAHFTSRWLYCAFVYYILTIKSWRYPTALTCTKNAQILVDHSHDSIIFYIVFLLLLFH